MDDNIYTWPGYDDPEKDDEIEDIEVPKVVNDEPSSMVGEGNKKSSKTFKMGGGISVTYHDEEPAPAAEQEQWYDPEHPLSQPSYSSSQYSDDHFLSPKNNKRTVTFNTVGVVLFIALIAYCVLNPHYLLFYFALAINVLLHELGHYTAGRLFKCKIDEVSLFFVPAVTFKENVVDSSYDPEYYSWRDTKWTLGALPFGGFTTFMTSTMPLLGDPKMSPFVNHKPAFARLIINGAGILVNFFTFLILFIAFPAGSSILIDEIMNIALVLSIINLLPFYPLDGSSILITIYEIVTGHKPSSGFMNVFKIAGAALMIYLFWINPSILNRLLAMILP